MLGARRSHSGVVGWLALSLTACGATEGDDPRRQLLSRWVNEFLLERYSALEEGANGIGDAVERLCAAPSESALGEARMRWHVARRAWKEAEVFSFGPVTELPHRLGPQVDFWPVRTEVVQGVLSSDAQLDNVAGLGADARGLPAIEWLLFAAEAEGFKNPRRCAYAVGLASDLAVRARALQDAWDPASGGFGKDLIEAGRGSEAFMTLPMALGEVVNRMGFLLENIRGDKLGRPAGHTTGGAIQPDKVESAPSGRSVEDILDNLRGIEILFEGEWPAADVPQGLVSYIDRRGRNLRAPLSGWLAECREALQQLDRPLSVAMQEDPAGVQAAITTLGGFQRWIQADVANVLSVTVGFNDNDGD